MVCRRANYARCTPAILTIVFQLAAGRNSPFGKPFIEFGARNWPKRAAIVDLQAPTLGTRQLVSVVSLLLRLASWEQRTSSSGPSAIRAWKGRRSIGIAGCVRGSWNGIDCLAVGAASFLPSVLVGNAQALSTTLAKCFNGHAPNISRRKI